MTKQLNYYRELKILNQTVYKINEKHYSMLINQTSNLPTLSIRIQENIQEEENIKIL